MMRAIRGGATVEIPRFGSFSTRPRQACIGRNSKTGARVEVPPKRIPYFKPSKELKDFVNTTTAPNAGVAAAAESSQP